MNESRVVEHYLKAALYQNLHHACKKGRWIHLTGPVVGLLSGSLTILTRIASIAENAIKGNGIACPLEVLQLPFSILSALSGLVSKTILIAVKPASYTDEKWRQHSLTLYKENQELALEFYRETAKSGDVESMKFLANHYMSLNQPTHYDEWMRIHDETLLYLKISP